MHDEQVDIAEQTTAGSNHTWRWRYLFPIILVYLVANALVIPMIVVQNMEESLVANVLRTTILLLMGVAYLVIFKIAIRWSERTRKKRVPKVARVFWWVFAA
ncbi:MAG: hypothetical protein KAV00_18460, partial [Phycisphaerae bacterium]|nr:hypothetical protein [Phycisphaerae bacterium]